jgi:hypothetical protein
MAMTALPRLNAPPLLGRRIRVEHWANALHGGPAAARSMIGQEVGFDRVPYFFSDQYDLGMEYSGYAEPGCYDRVVFRGDVPRREFVAFWLADGMVLAGMNVNVWDVTDHIQRLVRSGSPIDPDRLTNPTVQLTGLRRRSTVVDRAPAGGGSLGRLGTLKPRTWLDAEVGAPSLRPGPPCRDLTRA